jgi:outer membrane protein TolC
LALPDALVENISFEEIAVKSVSPNPEVVEAQQTIVKARAALTLAKPEYVPTVAAVSGYLFQNTIPAVPSNFGYGGIVASYTLVDFGKPKQEVKEARARLGMAEIALQLTQGQSRVEPQEILFPNWNAHVSSARSRRRWGLPWQC